MGSPVAATTSWAQTTELLYLLVVKELRVRYKGSFLGYVWALANPLAFTLVYYVAFQIIVRVQVENYALFLVTGLFPWTWMHGSLVQSTSAYRANQSLIRKVRIRQAVLPLSNAVHEMVHFFFAVPILLAGVVIATGSFHVSWLVLVPAMALIQLAIVYPLGLMLATANVFVRDVEYLITLLLQMLFFLTPIVYSESMIPEQYRWYFAVNPFTPMINAWRAVFNDGVLAVGPAGRCIAFAAAAGLVAWATHVALRRRIGELL